MSDSSVVVSLAPSKGITKVSSKLSDMLVSVHPSSFRHLIWTAYLHPPLPHHCLSSWKSSFSSLASPVWVFGALDNPSNPSVAASMASDSFSADGTSGSGSTDLCLGRGFGRVNGWLGFVPCFWRSSYPSWLWPCPFVLVVAHGW